MTKPFFTVSSLLPTLSSNHQCSLFGGGQKGGWYAFNVLHHILAATLCDEFIVCRHVLCMEPEASGETQKFRWVRDSSCSLPSFPCRQQQTGQAEAGLGTYWDFCFYTCAVLFIGCLRNSSFGCLTLSSWLLPLMPVQTVLSEQRGFFKVFLSEEMLEQGEYVWRV